MAKGLAVVVQLVAVGVAFRALGPDGFGSYLVMASLVAWLGLAAVGVGPGLTQRIATATAVNDKQAEATAFSSSLALSGLFVGGVAAGVLAVARLASQADDIPTAFSRDIGAAAVTLGIATSIHVWLSVVEAAQLGHQEQYFANAFQAIGLGSALAILLVGPPLDSVTAFVLATAAPPLLMKAVNALLYVVRRPYLVTRRLSIRAAVGVLSTSLAFAAVQLGSTASQQVGFLWLAFTAGPAATVPLGIMLRLNSAAAGAVSLVTQPLWPALADAVARHDTVWAGRAYHRALWLTVSYALTYAVALVLLGSRITELLTGSATAIPQLLMVLFGLYFIVGVWAHVNAITLVGLNQVWVAARVTLLEAAVSGVGAVVLVAKFGATGVILALLVASAIVSATLLPRAVRRSLPGAGRPSRFGGISDADAGPL